MRRFVLIGQTAFGSADFSLEDLPSSSGRLDVLLRSLRAALLVSHGIRRDVLVYLVLRGGSHGPRLLRISGASVKFLRPDERSLATLIKKTLAATDATGDAFTEVRPGIELCQGDLSDLLAGLGESPRFVLAEDGQDIRDQQLQHDDAWFFVGDHVGIDVVSLALLERSGCQRISVGPLSLHSDDVVALVSNELDRRFPTGSDATP